ncbi:PREDICTED: nucleolar protein 11-like [Priapulus caudatus]|uniref:Nucleolar protein 11-like n=1 Tax=Priapulus caudatus TaxID=37621 RepID=A0ABM1EEF7_PRICU|nr:PREDICTED: nucleolar protein 11-like [Priapulus caudatus]
MDAPVKAHEFLHGIDKSSLIGITHGLDADTLVFTHSRHHIVVENVKDRVTVSSWSMKQIHHITAPAVYSPNRNQFLTVVNKNVIHCWDKDSKIEQAKKYSFQKPIHQLFSTATMEPIILHANGRVQLFSIGVAQRKQLLAALISTAEHIVWSDAVELNSHIMSVMVTQTKEYEYKIYIQALVDPQSTVETVDAPLLLQAGTHVSSCCLHQTINKKFDILMLLSDGQLCSIPTEAVTHQSLNTMDYNLHKIPCTVEKNVSITSTGPSNVAAAPVKLDNIDVLGIWNLRFGTLVHKIPLSSPVHKASQLFYNGEQLFLPCADSVLAFPHESQPSTLASVLGMSTGMVDPMNRGSNETEKLCSLLKAGDLTNLTSSKVKQLLQSSLLDTKAFPRDNLLQFVRSGLIRSSILQDFVPKLIQKKDVYLLHEAMKYLPDVSDFTMVQVLDFYLSQENGAFSEIVAPPQEIATLMGPLVDRLAEVNNNGADEDADVPATYRQWTGKAVAIDQLLSMKYNDVVLMQELQKLQLDRVLVLLQYLYCKLKHSPIKEEATGTPDITQVCDWLSLLLDAHFSSFVLDKKSHVILLKIVAFVSDQVHVYNELASLEPILMQLREQLQLPTQKYVGDYCIEILCIR